MSAMNSEEVCQAITEFGFNGELSGLDDSSLRKRLISMRLGWWLLLTFKEAISAEIKELVKRQNPGSSGLPPTEEEIRQALEPTPDPTPPAEATPEAEEPQAVAEEAPVAEATSASAEPASAATPVEESPVVEEPSAAAGGEMNELIQAAIDAEEAFVSATANSEPAEETPAATPEATSAEATPAEETPAATPVVEEPQAAAEEAPVAEETPAPAPPAPSGMSNWTKFVIAALVAIIVIGGGIITCVAIFGDDESAQGGGQTAPGANIQGQGLNIDIPVGFNLQYQVREEWYYPGDGLRVERVGLGRVVPRGNRQVLADQLGTTVAFPAPGPWSDTSVSAESIAGLFGRRVDGLEDRVGAVETGLQEVKGTLEGHSAVLGRIEQAVGAVPALPPVDDPSEGTTN